MFTNSVQRKSVRSSLSMFSVFAMVLWLITFCLCVPGIAQKKVIRFTTIPSAANKFMRASIETYMEQHPDVKIIYDIAGEQIQYKANFPQIASSPDRPDMAWYWVDGRQYQNIVEAGLLVALDDLYEKEGWNEVISQSVVDKYTQPDGHKYAVERSPVFYPQIYYNRKIFAQAGVTAPQTEYMAYPSLEVWYTVIQKIRSAGYEPVSYGGGEGWIIGHTHDSLLQRIIPQDLLNDFYNNWRKGWKTKIHYTDQEWLEVDKMLLEWKEKGVFAKGFIGRNYPEGRMFFEQEQAAMYQDGSWAVAILRDEAPDIDFGWMIYPKIKEEITPKILAYAGNGLMILKGTPYVDICKDFLTFLMSKEQQTEMCKTISYFPVRTDIPEEKLIEYMDPVALDIWKTAKLIGTSTGWDDPVPADLAEQSFILFQELLTEVRSPESIGQALEKIAERHRITGR